jgi:peptidyl-prolyl cis-trans isomerase C
VRKSIDKKIAKSRINFLLIYSKSLNVFRKGTAMGTAKARHILVASQEECQKLKDQIDGGADFEALAKEHSQCPSGQSGGGLGEFSPGQMVKEFDQVVFNDEVGKVHGPVKTDFGYHLIEVTDREE